MPEASTARRVELGYSANRRQALALEQLRNLFAQLPRARVHHPRRDFFAADLK
jgi:hypothetical protein